MRDYDAGKVDMIITKSVSRFARNIVDCIDNAIHLRALNPPIGIFFETESIYTLMVSGTTESVPANETSSIILHTASILLPSILLIVIKSTAFFLIA